MTLQQLHYFLSAADLGSFNAAARAQQVSQPAVSEQVRRLEGELAVELFERYGRGLRLTPAGRRFRNHAERVVAAADEATASVGRGGLSRDRVVTLGTFRNAPYYGIAALASRFHARRPDARLRLPGQNSAEVAAAVRTGELEAGLVVLPVEDSGLSVTPLFRDEVRFVTRDPGRAAAPATVGALAAGSLVLYDAAFGFEDPTRRQLAARAQAQGLTLAPRFEVEHVETALQLVADGLGDTIASRSITRQAWFPAGLHTVGFEEPLFDAFALITRDRTRLSAGTRELVDAVTEWAGDVAASLA